jgi:hypothetical protein
VKPRQPASVWRNTRVSIFFGGAPSWGRLKCLTVAVPIGNCQASFAEYWMRPPAGRPKKRRL